MTSIFAPDTLDADEGDEPVDELDLLDPLDPETVRELPPMPRPVRSGGLTLPVLAFAALVASPAIWQCLVRHALPMHVMLERYVVIAIGCLLVSEVARRYFRPPADEPVAEAATEDEEGLPQVGP